MERFTAHLPELYYWQVYWISNYLQLNILDNRPLGWNCRRTLLTQLTDRF